MIKPIQWINGKPPIHEHIDHDTTNIYLPSDNKMMSTTQTAPTVTEAKRLLRQARLTEHREGIRKALDSSNDVELARACSRFNALFTNKGKQKVKK